MFTWTASCSSALGPAKCATSHCWWPSRSTPRGTARFSGIVEGAKEDKAGWSGFLAHLKSRGLRGVELIVSDACMGVVESVA
jgi:hypothetical protein